MRTCQTCGAVLVRHPKHSRVQWEAKRFCDRSCSNARLRKPHLCVCGCGERPLPKRKYVKGHRPIKLTQDGYRRVYRPDHPLADRIGMVFEHRLVLYDAGIEIPAGWHVHHVNEDKSDNRLANLEVLPVRDHVLHHARERGFVINQYGAWPVRA